MSPEGKQLLAEMQRLFQEQNSLLDRRFADSEQTVEHRIVDSENRIDGLIRDSETRLDIRITEATQRQDDRLKSLEAAAGGLETWRQDAEGVLDDMRLKVLKINKQLDRSMIEQSSSGPGLLSSTTHLEQADQRPSADDKAARPSGHGVATSPRENEFGVVTTLTHSPANGTNPPPKFHGTAYDLCMSRNRPPDPHQWPTGRMPKFPFPTFHGENVRLWISNAEDYFDIYQVEPHLWLKISKQQFKDSAAHWIQSIEPELKSLTWPTFCLLLHDRFGRDQHQTLIRKLFQIHQESTVSDYITQFSVLIDKLKAYNPNIDMLYYTTRFVDGLREDIRAVVIVQRPHNLDTAYTLALLQEEVTDSGKRKDHRREALPFHKASYRTTPPAPTPATRAADSGFTVPANAKTPEERFRALRAYRRAKGLCDNCAEKWSRDHRCAPTVRLNAMQEVFDLFSITDDSVETDDAMDWSSASPPADQLLLAISSDAMTGNRGARTMLFYGDIQSVPVKVLIDSGSTTSFISQAIVDQLQLLTLKLVNQSVQVANGETLQCTAVAANCSWTTDSQLFTHDLKVLPLHSYDIIVGKDWLEKFSPMKVDWKLKWMQIPVGTQTVTLHGCPDLQSPELMFQLLAAEQDTTSSSDHSLLPTDIQKILDDFPTVCAPPTQLPPIRPYDHSIPQIQGARPVNIRPYHYPPALKDEIESQVAQMLQHGLIQSSNSSFSSPVLMVRKKDGSWRFCIDYRYLNDLTVKGTYPIPVFEQLMDELSGARWFSILDLYAGYHQVRLKEGEEYKTAFSTHSGHFEFRVMAFGLTGAPNTFQHAMNCTLSSLLRKCVIVFFDDILVFSPTYEQHLLDLRKVFALLKSEHWHIKLTKCHFAQQQLSYLGHIISADGIATDPAKIEAIVSWPVPANVRELRSFLGLAGFYRKFIKHFAIITRPLTNLLKKGTYFIWTSEQQTAFDTLKQAMSSAPVLAIPDFTKQFIIETDASNNGVGAVLMQQGHPLAFISKPLGPRTQGLSTYEKEYMAILLAVEQWRAYLQHAEFLIYTDQKSLVHLNEQRLHTVWQQKVFTKLLGMQYKIVYKKGQDNRVADALSRRPHSSETCMAISTVVPQWCSTVVAGYSSDPQASTYITQLSVDPGAVPHFTLQNGLLRYKNRIWLGNNKVMQQRVIQALHTSAVGGHSGVPVTCRRVRQLFAWPGLKNDIYEFVTSCPTCQQSKPDRARYPGLLQPLPVPSSAWQSISMDFVEGLPVSHGYNCIMVIVDRFSKYSHFLTLKHPFSALNVAKLFMQQVHRLHGLPSSIISDRDRIFLSNRWQELFKLADVQLKMSSAYHPQTDGQTERVNQCMETFLRCFVNAVPQKWYDWIQFELAFCFGLFPV